MARRAGPVLFAILACARSGLAAQEAVAPSVQESPLELARELTNPFADIYHIPLNQNPDFGIGPDDDQWSWTLTIQPVLPIHLNEEWNLLSRTILPVIYRDFGDREELGLGDTTQTFYLSPRRATTGGWVWGFGPIFLLPIATEDEFGKDKWGAGPALGLLNRAGPWTVGLLANSIWSFAGSGDERVQTSFLQPFIDYTFDSMTTLSLNTESTYDWENREWSVPIHLVVRQLFAFGDRRITVGLGGRYYADGPDDGPEWGLRLSVIIVLPN